MVMSSSDTDSDDVSFFIRASRETGIDSFLSERGIRARRTHGPRNSIGDIAKTLAEHPEPYVFVTASALAVRAAFRAYADTHKKRIIVRDERGNEVDATNYSVEDLKKLNPINAFQVADEDDSTPIA
jgi:hypothetical protein